MITDTIPARSLTLSCFNVKGVMRNVLYLEKLLISRNIDVCVVTEHWLFANSLCFLDSINKSFVSVAVSDANLNPLDPYRRGKGGVGILWNERLTPWICKIHCNSDRIVGVSLQLSDGHSLTIICSD